MNQATDLTYEGHQVSDIRFFGVGILPTRKFLNPVRSLRMHRPVDFADPEGCGFQKA
jgi:hypothetical protein